jgi:aldehyde:ferredoxin oxidoreductase
MNGWMGTILRVNLTSGEIIKEPLDQKLARDYVGGRGLAVKMLFDEMKFDCDPLGSENILIFINGPLTITGVLSSGRYMVVTKSPLTGTICSSNSGQGRCPFRGGSCYGLKKPQGRGHKRHKRGKSG